MEVGTSWRRDILLMDGCHYAALLMLWCVLVQSDHTCDQTEFLHPNGTCVACPVCGPGEQLSEDCGFGDGGKGVCMLCEEGHFSSDTGVAPCRRCTKCSLLNRLKKRTCLANSDALCGQCLPGGLNSSSHGNEVHPTSIVINVTTNIKPSSQNKENSIQEDQQSKCKATEEMEQKLKTIWEMAQGQSIEMLNYDLVQDLSLLLDSADNRHMLRRLGQSLGVPPQVCAYLQGFQELFQYLRTSTYTLLPQLAQAAALLPNPGVVAKIHQAVVNQGPLIDVLP
ncbi:Tumor necrosis factor receptor superfamily member 19 TRADE Toxicity and JNK inducer Precursor [Channa argus]|uniref:Tumor necrosis factor receptor superfamily member 19 TRADE Toxicity and JNK inducer n=1 Tax=Channa argus TaxID=215402 RepID=A0A6G1PUY9_CHAAH|nr:Tumor necrosis factor receptor superfamily member 19 TRADE Toxicity and JNK inducer Precursor [Channa argus]